MNNFFQTVGDILIKPSKDYNLKRENANIDGDASMGQMLRVGSETTKEFYLSRVIPPKYSELHRNGDIHIHDLDFYSLTTTCCQIDIAKLLADGFDTGHGRIREPNSIGTAAALTCIAIQSNQNDQHGGQSVPNFDYGLAPYVDKTFRKNYFDALVKMLAGAVSEERTFNDVADSVERVWSILRDEEKQTLTLDQDASAYWYGAELKYLGGFFEREFLDKTALQKLRAKAIRVATEQTERDTFQAMEALVHNLNTMHCLRPSAKVWTRLNGEVRTVSVGELYERFGNDPFEVLSVNRATHRMEWKRLLKVTKLGAGRDMVKIATTSGQEVETTDNHLYLNYEDGAIIDVLAKDVEQVLTPRGFVLNEESESIDVSGFAEAYKNSPFQEARLRVSEALAKLFGLYVGDGSVCGGSQMVLTICDKLNEEETAALVEEAFGFKPTYKKRYYGDGKLKEYRFNVGTRLANALKNLCGACACEKKVPSFVVEGSDSIKKAFLCGYNIADGCKTREYFEASSVSRDLISGLRLLLLQLKEYPTTNKRSLATSGYKSPKTLYTITLGRKASRRLGLVESDGDVSSEAPKYDLRAVKGCGSRRKSGNVLYREFEAALETDEKLREKHGALVNYFIGTVKEKVVDNSGEENVYDLSVEDNENFLTEDCVLIHNSRAGAQVPFSSINYGTDTSAAGRIVIKSILNALDAGLGNGETPIFPIHIFRVKKGVNAEEGSPNYDLFKLACKVSAKRMFPNFSFQDAPYNLRYYEAGRPETEIAYMGCRTRVIGNVYDPENEIAFSRGNLSFTSINLPRIGIELRNDPLFNDKNAGVVSMEKLDKVWERVEPLVDACAEQLYHRFELQCARNKKNYPFMMGQNCWLGVETLNNEESLRPILSHGTLSVGFIGLAEMLYALFGGHHGEYEILNTFGLKLIGLMRAKLDAISQEKKLNYTLLATPAEGLSGRFLRIDRERYGIVPGVTDKEFYTNSFHVPVEFPISIGDKIRKEAPYHELTNAGHITYVELNGDPSKNLTAFEKIVVTMMESGIGYGAINHPIDRDPECGYDGVIDGDVCPRCGRKETKAKPFERIRRITGYLVGGLERFNDAKRAEESLRVKHG